MADIFDAFLISSCQIFQKSGALNRYKTETNDLTPIATVPCRVSSLTGKETIVGKEISINTKKIFMRPYAALTTKHVLKVATVGGTVMTYNILDIENPSLLDHHYEVLVEEVKP